MDSEPSTSMEVEDNNMSALGDGWTKNLKFIPGFSYNELQEHLVLQANKTPDGKPAEAFKHKKSGYKLFKAGYVRQLSVKANVRKGDEVHFLVRCYVNAEMKKKQYLAYVHLNQHSGKVSYARCGCPAGVGGCCKHVAATLFQILDYVELDLAEVPDDKTCTQELQTWHIPKKNTKQDALLFEDLIFPQETYEKDKVGRKRPIARGRRESYTASNAKVTTSDLKQLKSDLEEANSACSLASILGDNNCEPSDFNVNYLPSRQRIIKAEEAVVKLDQTEVRSEILQLLNQELDCRPIPNDKCRNFGKQKLEVNNEGRREIAKNTRKQNAGKEWYKQRQCRLTSSLFGCVIKRRKSIHPKSIISKVTKQIQTRNASCQWGIENEQNALVRYHQYKVSINEHVDICSACGLVVNPRWPWLGASPDALISDQQEKSHYGAVEVKCPSSKAVKTIMDACDDKLFCLELIDGKPRLKKNHIYYYQVQGVMAICQLYFLDFVVYLLNDMHVERVYFDNVEWDKNILPELTSFYFKYLMECV